MSSFGDKLRREREMRGVTLEEIAESTKIGTRSLRALEQEDFEKLPGGIFNKGFVRAYSRFLGLDEEQTVADFDLAWSEHESTRGPVRELPVDEKPEAERSTSKLLLAVLVVAIAVGVGWYAPQGFRKARTATQQQHALSPSQQVSTAQPSSSSPPSVSPADGQNSVSTPSATMSTEPSETPKALSNSNSAAESDASGQEPLSNSDSSDNADAAQKASISKTAGSAAPIRLKIFAREDSWLSILVDGKNIGQGVLSAQKSRTIRAQREVRLTVGNAGGVEVSFNGQAVDIGGVPKQVKELIFTPEGLQR